MESREVLLAREIWSTKQTLAEIATEAKATAEKLSAKEQALQDYLIAEGKTSTGHIAGVGIFSLKRENYPSVSQDRMPAFLKFLRDNKDGAIIVETVPAQALKKYCKDKLDALTENFVEDADYAEQVQSTLGLPEVVPPAELAKLVLAEHGVQTFQKIGLSHRDKGK